MPYAVEPFVIGGVSYLFVSNFQNGSSLEANSPVLRWNALTGLFEHHQVLSTTAAAFPRFFTIGDDAFLAVPSNQRKPGKFDQTTSKIYKWCGGVFVDG